MLKRGKFIVLVICVLGLLTSTGTVVWALSPDAQPTPEQECNRTPTPQPGEPSQPTLAPDTPTPQPGQPVHPVQPQATPTTPLSETANSNSGIWRGGLRRGEHNADSQHAG